MKKLIVGSVLCLMCLTSKAQIGLGFTTGLDLYQWHYVPATDKLGAYSTGAAIINANFGPKLWLGGPKFSISIDAQVSISPLAFDTKNFKGMGVVSFPICVDVNLFGLSGFNPLVNQGFSLGGGMIFTRTELYFQDGEFQKSREVGFHRAYFGQMAYGLGAGGRSAKLYARYAFNNLDYRNVTIGIMLDINKLKNRYQVDRDELYKP